MMLPDPVEELINAILDGEASEQDVAQLQKIIEMDAGFVSTLADRIAEHRLLCLIHQPFETEMCVDAVMDAIADSEKSTADAIIGRVLESSPAESSPAESRTIADDVSVPHGRYRSFVGWFVSVAVVGLLATGIWGILARVNRDRGESVLVADESNQEANFSVATILLQEDCVWSANHDLSEGQRLTRERIGLESGTAVLRFDGGAELIMVGPAAIDLKSAARVLVHLGEVVVRADDGAEGFVVMTPSSEVVDLGTEFAVKVRRDGNTEVHVLDGEVSYRKLDAARELAELLRAGESVVIDPSGRTRAIPMNSPRFQEFVNRINPRSRADLLIAYEGFNYSPGSLPLQQSSVGKGWTGPWRRRSPEEQRRPKQDSSPSDLEIVHGQMNVSWPVPGGRLGMLKLPPGNVFYVRPLKHALDLGKNSVTYFSLMVRELERHAESKPPYEHLRLTFRSSDDYFGDALSFGHGHGYRPRIQAGDGNLFTSPLVFPAEQTTLWIGKVVSRAGGEDEVSFRIYGEAETLDYAEPATWHVVTRGLNSDAKLDRVLISSTGKFGRIVDELRIGPTWRSVAPMLEVAE